MGQNSQVLIPGPSTSPRDTTPLLLILISHFKATTTTSIIRSNHQHLFPVFAWRYCLVVYHTCQHQYLSYHITFPSLPPGLT
jgi:hypothetical protein